jgi:hypothetical protein
MLLMKSEKGWFCPQAVGDAYCEERLWRPKRQTRKQLF